MARTRPNPDDDAAPAAGPRLSGVIKRLQRDRGFGFLAADGRDYFFHRSALDHVGEFESLTEGQTVTFEPAQGPKGLRAERLIVV